MYLMIDGEYVNDDLSFGRFEICTLITWRANNDSLKKESSMPFLVTMEKYNEKRKHPIIQCLFI